MKVFEKVQWSDGGPNDKGDVMGYIRASSLAEAKEILNVNHGFLTCREITKEEYNKRRRKAEVALRMFNLEG